MPKIPGFTDDFRKVLPTFTSMGMVEPMRSMGMVEPMRIKDGAQQTIRKLFFQCSLNLPSHLFSVLLYLSLVPLIFLFFMI
jgi:hypothetical protein